LNTPMCWIP